MQWSQAPSLYLEAYEKPALNSNRDAITALRRAPLGSFEVIFQSNCRVRVDIKTRSYMFMLLMMSDCCVCVWVGGWLGGCACECVQHVSPHNLIISVLKKECRCRWLKVKTRWWSVFGVCKEWKMSVISLKGAFECMLLFLMLACARNVEVRGQFHYQCVFQAPWPRSSHKKWTWVGINQKFWLKILH